MIISLSPVCEFALLQKNEESSSIYGSLILTERDRISTKNPAKSYTLTCINKYLISWNRLWILTYRFLQMNV